MTRFRKLWRTHRLLVVVFGAGLALTLFFAIRATLAFLVWEPMLDEKLAPWMPLGAVSRKYELSREEVTAFVGFDPERRMNLDEVAARMGLSFAELVRRLEDTFATDDGRQ